MRVIPVLSCCILAAALLTGCVGPKVGVIDSSRIYQESDAGRAGLAYLEQVEQDVKAKAEAAQRLAESMPDNEAMPLNLQRFFMTCQEAMNNAQQQAVNAVQDLITTSIATYREQQGMTVIMLNDAVVSADPAADVTDAIISEMNKSTVVFEPVVIPDFVPSAQ